MNASAVTFNRLRSCAIIAAIAGVCIAMPSRATAASQKAIVRKIVSTFAKNAVADGQAIGVEVGVVVRDSAPGVYSYGGEPAPHFFSYGYAVDDPRQPRVPIVGTKGPGIQKTRLRAHFRAFTPDSIFQIGSVTKVFTTNLLGQQVDAGTLQLNQSLSDFQNQTGTLNGLILDVTLEELGDFTGGFPSYAPLCSVDNVPGCLPSGRPTIQNYTGQDFAQYFQNTEPFDFADNPPQAATSLPAPYNYSDYSIGLLGLLLGGQPNTPLSNDALTGWFTAVQNQILTPLGMKHTYLFQVNGEPLGRIVDGYDQALATATVTNGQISAIDVAATGAKYNTPPKVRIVGGGGSGAKASASIDGNGHVAQITVTDGGKNYIAPAKVTFNNGGSTTIATAATIVAGGKVVGIQVLNGGSGYTQVPDVTISGGRKTKGSDATAVAHIANGKVTYVEVTDGGAAYVPKLSVRVAPGAAFANNIPIWAPAGAISSSMRDMVKFAAAALGHSKIGKIDVPAAITNGFAISETPYACAVGSSAELETCPQGASQSALAWAIQPADPANHYPEIVTKNGGIPGFSTQIVLMPARDMAVVVFANSREDFADTGVPTTVAGNVAFSIISALNYELP